MEMWLAVRNALITSGIIILIGSCLAVFFGLPFIGLIVDKIGHGQ